MKPIWPKCKHCNRDAYFGKVYPLYCVYCKTPDSKYIPVAKVLIDKKENKEDNKKK